MIIVRILRITWKVNTNKKLEDEKEDYLNRKYLKKRLKCRWAANLGKDQTNELDKRENRKKQIDPVMKKMIQRKILKRVAQVMRVKKVIGNKNEK